MRAVPLVERVLGLQCDCGFRAVHAASGCCEVTLGGNERPGACPRGLPALPPVGGLYEVPCKDGCSKVLHACGVGDSANLVVYTDPCLC